MLMDEPFGALDPLTRDALGAEYRRLHETMRLTTLMVTHDVLEAVLLADRIIVMRAGEIAADGSPQELMNARADADVRSLMDTPRRQALRVAELLKTHEIFEAVRGANHEATKIAVERIVRLYEEWKRPDAAET